MKHYKGYYIDGVHFTNESKIDAFLLTQAIERYEMLARMFTETPSMEVSVMMGDQADRLHTVFGLSYDEIETIEIEAMKSAA